MLYRSRKHRNQRRGIVLLLVITFLALFAAVALSFVYYAEAEASSSNLASLTNNKTIPDVDPEMLLSYFLRQLLYDSDDNPYSAMRGHSLARTMWGAASGGAYNGIGRIHYANAAIGGKDDYYYPNYQYYPTGNPKTDFVRDPEYYGVRTPPSPWQPLTPATGLYRPGNAPYTYPDMNNMFLARVDIDPTTGMPVVITPSFHRPYLDSSSRYGVLWPTNQDYHTGFNPPDADLGGHVRNLDFSLGYKYVDPTTGKISYYNNDSYWMDLGFPWMIAPNGKKYKPLFAALVTDLDNRMNIFGAGNNRGVDPTTGNKFHVSNRGYGPTEMNLNYLWHLQQLTPGTLKASNGVGVPVIANELNALIGTRTLAPLTAASQLIWPQRDGPYYARIDFDGLNSGGLVLPGAAGYGVAPNNYFTMPNYPSPTPGVASPPYAPFPPYPWYASDSNVSQPLELVNHPLLFNNYANVRASNLEAILRHRGTGAPAVTSDLFQGMPQTFKNNFLRSQLTSISWSLDRSASSPYRWYGPNGTYVYNPTKLYPQGQPLTSPPYAAYTPQSGSEFTQTLNGALGSAIRVNLNRISTSNGTFDYPAQDGNGYIDIVTNPANALQFTKAQTVRQQLAKDVYNVFLAVTGALNPNTATVVTAVDMMNGIVAVQSTAGFPSSGIINVNTGATGIVQVTYTGTTGSSFTGCAGAGLAMVAAGQVVTTTANNPATAQYMAARWLAQLAVNIVDYIDKDDISTPWNWYTDPNGVNPPEFVFGTEMPRLVINEAFAQVDNDPTDPMLAMVGMGGTASKYNLNVWTELLNPGSPPTTMVTAASNGQPLPQGTINVISTAGFGSSGIIYINLGGTMTSVTYTGVTATSFTGCTGGAGALATGQLVTVEAAPQDYGITRLTVNMPLPTLPIDAMSNGQVLPAAGGPIYVTDAANAIAAFPQAGIIAINLGGNNWTTVNYNGIQAATMTMPAAFLNCTGGTGTLMTGQIVKPYNSAYRITLEPQDLNLRAANNNNGKPAGRLNGPSFWDATVAAVTVLPSNGQALEGGTPTKNNGFFLVGPSQAPTATFPAAADPGFTPMLSYPSGQMAAPINAAQATALTTNGTTVLLRRLACPYIPPQPNPLAPNYNPYITVDYAQNVKTWDARIAVGANAVTPPGEATYYAMGRTQPYGAAFLAPQTNAPAGQPKNSFFQQNGPLTTPFNWLTHLDRPVVNQIELLHVSGYRPHELTQQFITYSFDVNGALQQTPYTHRAPWSDESALIYRALELLGVPSYINGASTTVTDANGYTMPIGGGRVPARININTLNDVFLTDPATGNAMPAIFTAMCDPQLATPNNVSSFTQADVVAIYNAMITSRSPGNAALGIPVGNPGPADAPFRSFAAGWIPAAAGDTQYPQGAGMRDTLLRPVTINGNVQPLFVPPSQVGNTHPYRQLELLQKVFNNITTTSNVFAVWLTVGFFEVDDTVTPPRLLSELGYDQGRNIRHRFFAIVDRSVLTGYPGPVANYNPRSDPTGAVLYFTVIK